MRNLKLKSCKQLGVKVHNVKQILLNPNISPKETDETVHVVSDDKLYEIKTVTGSIKEIAAVPGIVAAEYLALNDEICLATEGGEVLAVSSSSGAINECTFCDIGLKNMSWSPDQEVAVFITKADTLVVMTCTYDVINEHMFKENCDPESQFVNVGWGKKETQFHGSEGKAAAKQKSDFKPPENVEELPQNIEITWRADSSYFAVSFVNNEVGRMFKIFKKEGELVYISERSQGLQYPVAWRPSGNWIAMPQILPNKSTISLFEKNGLRHREITLPFEIEEEPIQSLRWSNDSDILAVETLDPSTKKQYIYLYTIGNYHWYLKQVLTFEQTDRIAYHCWDQRIGEEKTLHILLENGRCLIYRWYFDFDRFARSGLVVVIDGAKLLFTDFSKAIPPPPMCSKEFQTDAYINAIAMIKANDGNLLLCVYDAKERIQLFNVIIGTNSISFTKICIFQRQEPELERHWTPPVELGNFFLLDEDHFVATVNIAEKSIVFLFRLLFETKSYKTISSLKLNSGAVCSCMGFETLQQFFVQTLNGKVYQISINNEPTLKLDKVYQQLDHGVLTMEWCRAQSAQDCLISLLYNQRLYIDNELLAGDVTSFCLAGNYLAYTKLTELNFVLLSTRQHAYKRNMERGGRLVTTIANDARVLLQMPRGNLEVICPRVLALEIIGQMLDQRRYREAFNMLRKQRINFNIICDHNMVNFVKNLNVFFRQIRNPQLLNLFLNDLQNEDYSKTMYACNYTAAQQTYPEGFEITSKVNYICTLLYKYMSEDDPEHFRLPIITGFVKIGKVEEALRLVWEAKKQQNLHAKYVDNSMLRSAEEALKHLLYLVDVNELYNVALGTYDFDLVLYVAEKSQKDPKEFLPFLNELKQLEMNYRHYKIDLHLKRYDKALENIAKCGPEKIDEALEFMNQHLLYKKGLKCYENCEHLTELEKESRHKCHMRICLAFADHLRTENDLASASIMYERGGNLAQALLCSKHILDWQRVLMLAQRDTKDAQDVGTVVLSMLPALLEQGHYQVAHELQKTYGKNFKQAIKCLVKGHLYFQAIVEVSVNSEEVALLEQYVKPKLLAYVKQLQEQLSDDETDFIAHKKRLHDVRLFAQLKRTGFLNNDEVVDIDEADLLSDTTSMRSSRYTGSSQGTGKTFCSAKNRRKHERKLLSLKPGNPFEDIALIDALHNEVMKLVNQQEQVRDTCKALIKLQMNELASSLQKQYAQILTLLQDSFDTIWTEEMANAHTMQYKQSPYTDYTQLQNEQRYALLAPHKRFKPQINIIDWMCEVLA